MVIVTRYKFTRIIKMKIKQKWNIFPSLFAKIQSKNLIWNTEIMIKALCFPFWFHFHFWTEDFRNSPHSHQLTLMTPHLTLDFHSAKWLMNKKMLSVAVADSLVCFIVSILLKMFLFEVVKMLCEEYLVAGEDGLTVSVVCRSEHRRHVLFPGVYSRLFTVYMSLCVCVC